MIKKLMAVAAIALTTICSTAATLPDIGTGTEPNQWTSNLDGVLTAAKKTGYPIFLAAINDSRTGEGCSHCWGFITTTINNSEFTRIANSYKFYMVMINYTAGWPGYNAGFYGYAKRFGWNYMKDYLTGSLPVVAVIRPTGTTYRCWGQAGNPSGDGYVWDYYTAEAPKLYVRIEKAIKELSVMDSTFTLDQSSATLDSTATWTGKITRSGNSGKTGTVTVELSGNNSGEYTVDPASISWNGSDGTKNITVKRTATTTRVVCDEIKVKITASGFSGSTIKYGTQEAALTFKDSRIGKTLSEFAKANSGLDNLASSDSWFVPKTADGNILETVTSGTSTLTWTATAGGVLTLAGNIPEGASMKVSGAAGEFDVTAQATTIGVAVGDQIVFTAKANESALAEKSQSRDEVAAQETTIGFSQFAFTKLALTLSSPKSGASISYSDLESNKSAVDLKWSASGAAVDSYEAYGTKESAAKVFSGTKLYEGEGTSVNAVDAGLMKTDMTSLGQYWWGVRVTGKAAEHGTPVTTVTSTFTISALPQFASNLPSSITIYLKASVSLDYSAAVAPGTTTYSAKSLPKGLSIDSKTGKITGTPKNTGTKTVTVTAKNQYGSATFKVKMKVAKLPNSAKGNYNGVLFDSEGNPAASITWKTATSGKWSATIVKGSSKTKISGQLNYTERGVQTLVADGLTLSLVSGTKVWTGKWSGLTVYGKAEQELNSTWTSVWNFGIGPSSGDEALGYLKGKLNAKRKFSSSGKVDAKSKIAVTGEGLLLDAAFVKKYLGAWNTDKDAFFVYGFKKASGNAFDGGLVFYADGKVAGSFKYRGAKWKVIDGGKWPAKSLSGANNKTFSTDLSADGTPIEFTLKASEKKLEAASSALVTRIKAKISAAKGSGIYKGSFKVGSTTYKFEGALFMSGSKVKGLGGGLGGSQEFSTSIE